MGITMRDPRFIAAHRGGMLAREDHGRLARWAADIAESVLGVFEATSGDSRPRDAIGIARKWAEGQVKTGVAMKASLAAHVAAREAADPLATWAARAAGQAVASAHAADHSLGALYYALKVGRHRDGDVAAETARWLAALPDSLRSQVADGIEARLPRGFRSPADSVFSFAPRGSGDGENVRPTQEDP
jgi:hypothetical protein